MLKRYAGKEPSAVRVAAPGRPGWKSTRKDESMSLIEIRDVHKWYGEFHVLKGISERVEKGEVLVICGPSGSGKSSLIRCLNRLEPIQKGDILFEGTSIYAPEVDVNALRAEVGMVFQQFNLYPHLTVLENVTLAPIKVRGMGKEGGHGSGHGTARPRGHRASGRQAPEQRFPAGSSSVSPSPARSPCSPAPCCSTNPLPPSTRK